MAQHISYPTVKVDGLSIFYREAGLKDAPTILLLHGLPSSSRMFEPLLTRLAGQFHMVAPDYPGFGHSDAPTPKEFSYTFDNVAKVMDHFTESLNLTKYTLYMQDYGGPVGFRMALAHPDRVEALSFKMPSPTTKVSARTGRQGASSGRTAPQTRRRCGPTCSLSTPRGRGTWATTRTPKSTIPISGPTNTRS